MNIWTGIVLGVIGLSVWGLSKLSRAAGELETQIKGRIYKINLEGIFIIIDTIIKNPTGTEVNITYPFIKLMHGEKVLAVSNIKDERISIRPYQHTNIDHIFIPISYLNLGSLAPEVLKRIKDQSHKIKMHALISTRVSFAGADIPYSFKQEITI